MASLSSSLLLVLPTLVLALTSSSLNHKKSDSWALKSHNVVFDPDLLMYETLLKYGETPPADLEQRVHDKLGKRDTTGVLAGIITTDTTTTGYYIKKYSVPITLGGQNFTVELDTGSSNLWIGSTQLPASQQGANNKLYDPSASGSSFAIPNFPFSLGYGTSGSSSVSGNIYYDSMKIGNLEVAAQAIGVANSVAARWTQSTIDGLMGLSVGYKTYYSNDFQQQRNFMENILPCLDNTVIGIDLRRNATSYLDIGAVSTTRGAPPNPVRFANVPATEQSWTVPVSVWGTDNAHLYNEAAGRLATLDTGAPVMYRPTAQVDLYYAQMPTAYFRNSAWYYPCSSTPPDLILEISGANRFIIRGPLLTLLPYNGACYGAVQNWTRTYDLWGAPFFESVYVTFKYGGVRYPYTSRSVTVYDKR